MKKISRLPHEQVSGGSDDGLGPNHDGLPAGINDVEAHVLGHTKGERFLPGLPGTGGDQLRQVTPDDGDDVEGHILGHTKGERFGPGQPGTGGDQV